MTKTVCRKVVTGLRGVADFVIENLDSIKDGGTVAFAVETEAEEGDDFDTIQSNSTGWYGIEESKNAAGFDNEEWQTVLYMSYYGYNRCPMVHSLGDEFYDDFEAKELTKTITEMVWCGESGLPKEDEQIYVECRVEEKEEKDRIREYREAADKTCLHCLFSGTDGENCENCPVRKTMDKLTAKRA